MRFRELRLVEAETREDTDDVRLENGGRPPRHGDRCVEAERGRDGGHLGEVGELTRTGDVRHRRQDRPFDDRAEQHVRRQQATSR